VYRWPRGKRPGEPEGRRFPPYLGQGGTFWGCHSPSSVTFGDELRAAVVVTMSDGRGGGAAVTGIVAVVAAVAVVWAGRLAVLPYGRCRCRRAERSGHGIGSGKNAWSHCRSCAGKGEVPRIGARTVNRLIRRREI
jgi:hypothetical protein